MWIQRQDNREILTLVLRWTQDGKENGGIEKRIGLNCAM
jgi:hypothetical protein